MRCSWTETSLEDTHPRPPSDFWTSKTSITKLKTTMSSQTDSQIVQDTKENTTKAIDQFAESVSENAISAANFVSEKANDVDEEYHVTEKMTGVAEAVVDEGRKVGEAIAEAVVDGSRIVGETFQTSDKSGVSQEETR